MFYNFEMCLTEWKSCVDITYNEVSQLITFCAVIFCFGIYFGGVEVPLSRALPCLLIHCTVMSVFGGVPSFTIFPQQSLPFSQRRSSLGRYYCQFSLLGSVNIYMGYFLWNLKPQGLKSGMKFSFMNRGPNLIYYLGEEERGVRRFWLLLL